MGINRSNLCLHALHENFFLKTAATISMDFLFLFLKTVQKVQLASKTKIYNFKHEGDFKTPGLTKGAINTCIKHNNPEKKIIRLLQPHLPITTPNTLKHPFG